MIAADTTTTTEIDVATTLRRVAAGWRMIAATVVIALIGAAVYLHFASYKFAVEMRLAPVASMSGDGLSAKLSSLGGLAAVAGVSLPDGSGGSNSFKLFVEALHSRDVADILARDPAVMHGAFAREWNARARRWVMPSSFVHDVAGATRAIVGIPAQPFSPPGAARLQQWLSDHVLVDQNVKTPVVTLTMLSDDPRFAMLLLDRLVATADALLRERTLLRSNAYISYLSERLPTITLAEQRVAIAAALGEQERLKMAASSNQAYAAEVFEHSAASDRPVSPAPLMILAIAVAAGLGAGVALALFRNWRPRATVD